MKRWITLVSSFLALAVTAVAQDTVFTFNGRLVDSAALANNVYDAQFELFSAQSDGVSVSAVVSTNNLPVTNGLFTAFLDFGAAPFSGATRYLEIRLRPGGTADPYTTLAPRLQITSVPYAIRTATAGRVSGTNGLRTEWFGLGPNVVGGTPQNYVAPGIVGATIAGGGRLLGNDTNVVSGNYGAIGGGLGNFAAGIATVAGGFRNRAEAGEAFIGGGTENLISSGATSGVIDGGYRNRIDKAEVSAIGGGRDNLIQTNADYSVIAGGNFNRIQTNSTASAIGGGQRNTIGGYTLNGPGFTPAEFAAYAVVGGGLSNYVKRAYGVIGGGEGNTVWGAHSVVGGGYANRMFGTYGATVGTNCCEGSSAVIAGGEGNEMHWSSALASYWWSTISGGAYNRIHGGSGGVIGGGAHNFVGGLYSVVPGGESNSAAAAYSLAAGYRAGASHIGSFVWADWQSPAFSTIRTNEFAIRAAGGVRVDSGRGIALNAADRPIITRGFDPFTSGDKIGLGRWGLFMEPFNLVIGMPNIFNRNIQFAKYNPDGTRVELARIEDNGDLFTTGAVNPPSDRNIKTNFVAVNGAEVLKRLTKVPIQTWAYTNAASVRHIGPMAQDFYAAFGVGSDDKHISTVDADGVALAAIQGLHQLLQETRKDLVAKDAEMKQLREEYTSLKQIVRALAQRVDDPQSAKPIKDRRRH